MHCSDLLQVKRCPRARPHDWTLCPFAHPGEKAKRRDPRRYKYTGTACPDFRKVRQQGPLRTKRTHHLKGNAVFKHLAYTLISRVFANEGTIAHIHMECLSVGSTLRDTGLRYHWAHIPSFFLKPCPFCDNALPLDTHSLFLFEALLIM